MKRILLVLSVAALMAAMLALMAVPAFATVHELANAECAAEGAPANDQSPPGLTGGSNENADNFAQPVVSVYDTPSGGASHNALRGPAPTPPFPEGTNFGTHPGTDNCVNI
jgi:hypothetical protein